MRIAILGSTNNRFGDVTDPAELQRFCLRLGQVLGRCSHSVLVASERETSADRWVVDGIVRTPGTRARVRVYHRSRRGGPRPFDGVASGSGVPFHFESLPERLLAPSHMRMLRDADAAIFVGGGGYAYPAGLAAALMGVRILPVATFGGAARMLWQEYRGEFPQPRTKMPGRDTWEALAGDPDRVLGAIRREIGRLPRLMLVHGRSDDYQRVKEILQGQGFQAPEVIKESSKPGVTITEKFEAAATQSDGALVLFTPDDEAAALMDGTGLPLPAGDVVRRARARQNVCLEYGWFWGKIGRDRVLLLLKGRLELPSDIAGLSYESYSDDPIECRPAILSFVQALYDR